MNKLTCATVTVAMLAVAAGCACNRSKKDGGNGTGVIETPGADGVLDPPEPLRPPRDTPHPRILLDPPTIERIRAAARDGTPAWRRVATECERHMESGVLSAGYQGLQWTEAIANLTLCWYATGEQPLVERAMMYVEALLDDDREVGDGGGGNDEVHSDSGYPIRSRGVYAALAYDWLHDAPGMTEELRAKIRERLDAWLTWYAEDGYLNDNPYANYFWGYMTALSMAGIALDGDSEKAPEWLARSRELLEETIIPAWRTKLAGGEWAEGWQYGQLVATEAAMVIRAYETATGASYAKEFPWFAETVDHHLHMLLPDRRSVYDNATRHHKPPKPDPSALAGAALVLPDIDPTAAAAARFIAEKLYPRHPKKRVWVTLLGERPDAARHDPRGDAPLSNHMPGPGLTLARSSWDADAVWVSYQAGPKIAVDHQHNDQGHFEMWRGADALVVDGGGPFGFATINHNTLLIDDDGRVLNYTPNQGVWGTESRTVAFGDDGHVVVAVGDLADAWNPKCVERGCDDRAVHEVVRTFVYVRPNLVVIDDRVVLDRGSDGVTFAYHVGTPAKVEGPHQFAVIGQSRLDVHTLHGEPARVLDEPTHDPTNEPRIYKRNTNQEGRPMWRVEIDTPRGDRERRLLHWITASAATETPAVPMRIDGAGLSGARGATDGGSAAVLFAGSPAGGAVVLPAVDDLTVIAGLEPGASYAVTASEQKGGCALTVARGGDHRATSGGFIRLSMKACEL